MDSQTLNIGIFGGTFNPPHSAHIIVAEHLLKSIPLDKIIFVPSFITPHKDEGEEELAGHRLEMVRLATKGRRYFEVSDIEIQRRGKSFTYETVETFNATAPNDKLFVIMGMDNFLEFETWKFPERIVKIATLLVMTRPAYDISSSSAPFFNSARFVPVPSMDISSSSIRDRIKTHRSIHAIVPPAVEDYIVKQGLYQ